MIERNWIQNEMQIRVALAENCAENKIIYGHAKGGGEYIGDQKVFIPWVLTRKPDKETKDGGYRALI